MRADGETPKFSYIDALRGWAILLVLLVHAGRGLDTIRKLDAYAPDTPSGMELPNLLQNMCDYGYNGVTLFFVVSALSLTLSAANRDVFILKEYIIRRFLRIAPMFYLGAFFYLALFGWGPRWFAPSGINMTDFLSTLAFVHIWRDNAINSVVPGGWSIGVEATFYAILPMLLWAAHKSLPRILVATVIAFIATQSWYMHAMLTAEWKSTSYFEFINQLPVFLVGISVAFCIKKYPQRQLTSLLSGLLLLSMIVVIPLWAVQQNQVQAHFPFAILAGILCYTLHFGDNRLIVNNVFEKIGKVSFSMYLIHFALLAPLFALCSRIIASRGWGFFLFYYGSLTVITFICAAVTYVLIEAPCIRFSHHLSAKNRGK